MARETKDERLKRLGSIVERELAQAENSGAGAEAMRQKAVNYYLCRPRGDERENRSKVVSSDVADMINAVLAMLVPMLSADAVVELEPESRDDEEQAALESDALNRLIIEDNQGAVEIQEAVKDALLLRNGAMKIWREPREVVEEARFPNLSAEERSAFAVLVQEQDPYATVKIRGDRAEIRRDRSRFRVAAVPIENLSWSSGEGRDLQGVRFFAEAMDLTRSELIARGIAKDKVEALGTSSRKTAGPREKAGDEIEAESDDQELIGCHDAYLLIDEDGDGVSERWRLLVADENTVLEAERVEMIPYAVGTAFINPHRLQGEALSEHMFQVQDVKTALSRELINNVMLSNNGRMIYNPAAVSEEDILTPGAGGGIRARDVGQVMPVVIPDVTGGILSALAYQDKRRTERGGASLDMMQADAQIIGDTAHGIERQYGSREAMVSLMGSNLAETLIRGLYTVAHAFLRAYADRPLMVRRQGQYVPVDPREWPERTRLNVTVGMTPGQRGHMQNTLLQLIQLQAQGLQAGLAGQLVSMGTLHGSLVAWLRMAGVPNPEALLVDPASEEARAAAQAAAQQAQETQAQQAALVERQLAIEERKVAVDEMKIRGDLAHKYFETETDMAMKEAELVTGARVDLEKQAREAAAQARREAAAAQAGAGERGEAA